MTPLDDDAGYLALRDAVGAVELRRDTIRVWGRDAVAFLHGQLSQDIEGLPVGSAAWSLLLQPQGKVDAWLRVRRAGEDDVVLDVDEGFGEGVLARLTRFKLRTRCEFEPGSAPCVAVRGPLAPDASTVAGALPTGWLAGGGFDLVGEHAVSPESLARCSRASFERLRIEAGAPGMGAELDERTIPAEAGIVAQSVSFTKGCYTGQELVARIDSRGGNVPRRLRGIRLDDASSPPPPLGTAVVVAGKTVGTVTSAAPAMAGETAVALAYVGRAVEPPAPAAVGSEGGEASATVLALPLL